MFVCKIENSRSEIITLTQNESEFQVIKIDGLNPPNAQINTSNIAGLDGAIFNSSKLETRNIVIYLKLNGDIAANRIKLYDYFTTKERCNLYYKNDYRDVYIECYVQSVEVTPFSQSEIMQVSLLCPQPYFKDIAEIIDDLSHSFSQFKFPFSINYNAPVPVSTVETNRIVNVYNNSESESGVIILIDISTNVNKILIRNVETGEYFGLDSTDGFLTGDLITVNTNRGEKSVTLLRNGVFSNMFSKIISGSKFFQLSKGDNYFGYVVNDTGENNNYVNVIFKHRSIYRGV